MTVANVLIREWQERRFRAAERTRRITRLQEQMEDRVRRSSP